MTTIDIAEALGSELLAWRDGSATRVPVSTLEGKHIGLYFSAHWCPPCRSFTPLLCKTYAKLQEVSQPFEVVFVSSDEDDTKFMEYYKEMPWCAVPWKDHARRNALSRRFGVQGIPSLIILGPDGKVLNRNARGAVLQDRTGDKFPWEGMQESWQFSPWLAILGVVVMWAIFKMFIDT